MPPRRQAVTNANGMHNVVYKMVIKYALSIVIRNDSDLSRAELVL